jgi:hypothetical protein
MKLGILLLALLYSAIALPTTNDNVGVTVHEWGTFTSIAGQNGEAMAWRSYATPADLPCFVDRFPGFKGGLIGSVRMETPVIYFYSSQNAVVDVSVHFNNGTITEWFPKIDTKHTWDALGWRHVHVLPNSTSDFPVGGQSHYFTARETDAAPLEFNSQHEKFLFYRGVGTVPLPIAAKATDDKILIKALGSKPVAGLIVFENQGGHRRYRLLSGLEGEVTVDLNSLEDNWAGLLMDLERVLIDQGLYQREARAMIETWRDSWFEEGTRLFYIVPRSTIDSALPLDIKPAASQIERVFVGRMELITPAAEQEVRNAVEAKDRRSLQKHGRFLEPIAQKLGLQNALLDSIYSNALEPGLTCSK